MKINNLRSEKAQTKRYHLLNVNNQSQLFCRLGEKWMQDRVCHSMNEMLREGLIADSTVLGWIAAQDGIKPH